MPELPDQKQLWDAYGHAMGASVALELIMRIAILDAARKQHAEDAEARAASANEIMGMTFGQTAKEFMKAYDEFGADERFVESIGNARDVRNAFAHHFLEYHIDGFRSERGVKLVTLECIEATNHFRSLEQHIRGTCPVDFDEFFRLGESNAEAYVANHPLRGRLEAIEAGEQPEPLP